MPRKLYQRVKFNACLVNQREVARKPPFLFLPQKKKYKTET